MPCKNNQRMKKITFVLFLFAFTAMVFSSCKKTYECHCEGPNGAHEHFDIKAKNKSAAKSECDKKEGGSFTSCEIE